MTAAFCTTKSTVRDAVALVGYRSGGRPVVVKEEGFSEFLSHFFATWLNSVWVKS